MSGPKKNRSHKRSKQIAQAREREARRTKPARAKPSEATRDSAVAKDSGSTVASDVTHVRPRDAMIGLVWTLIAALGVATAALMAYTPPQASLLLRISVLVVGAAVTVMLVRALVGSPRARPVSPGAGMTFAGLGIVLLGPVSQSRWDTWMSLAPTLAGVVLVLLGSRRQRRDRNQRK